MNDQIRSLAKGIDGWLKPREAQTLFSLAKAVPAGQCIVELGSFQGRSTACLAEGSKVGNQVAVYAVDPHTGSPEHQVAWGTVDTYLTFKKNLERFGLWRWVTPLVKTSAKAAKDDFPPIGLLFIDARHEKESVREDFRLWAP